MYKEEYYLEVELFYHIALPLAIILLLVFLVLAVHSCRKKHKLTVLALICLLLCASIGWFTTSWLVGMRARNSSYYDNYNYEYDDKHYDDAEYYMKTDVEVYWDDKKKTSFKYDGDKWVKFGNKLSLGEWARLFEGSTLGNSTLEWRREHALVNVLELQSLEEKIAAYQYIDTYYSRENASGKDILVGTVFACCRKKDEKAVIKYYTDLNHYDITNEFSDGVRWEMPSVITNWLNDAPNQDGERVDWPTKKYGGLKDAHIEYLDIISKDELFKGTLEIAIRDEKYYLYEQHSDNSHKVTGPEKNKIIRTALEIPDYVYFAMQPYLRS